MGKSKYRDSCSVHHISTEDVRDIILDALRKTSGYTRNHEQEFIHDFINRHFVSVGMCADVCVHYAKKNNPHAHVMLTMRPIDE
ncbi:MAG: MobA/MobL family protein, partial [Clostridiales bacterium]|nr:MobA/MobL family protein [Clostridiales bacterium]